MFYMRCFSGVKIMKYIIKPILRLLAFIGIITVIPILVLYLITGMNWFELFDLIEEW
jgi:hypothetical protein